MFKQTIIKLYSGCLLSHFQAAVITNDQHFALKIKYFALKVKSDPEEWDWKRGKVSASYQSIASQSQIHPHHLLCGNRWNFFKHFSLIVNMLHLLSIGWYRKYLKIIYKYFRTLY